MTEHNLVSCKEEDFLDQDPPLRSQNYVCLSFLSPEEIIKRKEAYFFEKYISNFSKIMVEFFDHLEEKYSDETLALKNIRDTFSHIFSPENINNDYLFFLNQNSGMLEDDYYKQNNFQTSMRGIKVRGVFDTLREAEIRAQVLKRTDGKFNVYVAQVGCWCPWNPSADEIEDQEYAETHLNTLMKHYKTNQVKKDIFYEERKKELQFAKVDKTSNETSETPIISVPTKISEIVKDDLDPWMKRNISE